MDIYSQFSYKHKVGKLLYFSLSLKKDGFCMMIHHSEDVFLLYFNLPNNSVFKNGSVCRFFFCNQTWDSFIVPLYR